MKKYTVVFHHDAETDIRQSFDWGCRVWGETVAKTWARELYRIVKLRLESLPLSCPLAPESDDLGVTVRQLIVNRYRILFIVEKQTVTVLHLRVPFTSIDI